MSAATSNPMRLIEQARADGVQIVIDGHRVKLRGNPGALARWTPELRPHKAAILAMASANDAHHDLTEAQAERAAITQFDGEIDAPLADLLALHSGYDGVNWARVALTDAEKSALWVVQRPDGKLTVLHVTQPIPRPASYPRAWPARWTTPEPLDEVPEPAAQAAGQIIRRARQSCWACRHLDASQRPTCAKGHAVGWQLRYASGNGSCPRRLDRLDCGDQEHD